MCTRLTQSVYAEITFTTARKVPDTVDVVYTVTALRLARVVECVRNNTGGIPLLLL
jgi:hypothetical protein